MSGVRILKQSLFDEFEVRGYWSIPGTKDEIPGTLIRKKSGTTLEIFGRLEDQMKYVANEVTSTAGGSLNKEDNEKEISLEEEYLFEDKKNELPEMIWGFTEKGEKITILSYHLSNSRSSIPGFPVQSFYVSQFLVGEHINNLNELDIESLRVEFTYMSTWLGMSTLQSSAIFEDSKHVGNYLQTNNPENMNVQLHSIDAVLENTGTFSWNSDRYEKADISFTSLFKLTANTSKDFEWYTDKMFSLQKLLTLLSGHSIYTKNVSFKGIEESEMFYGKERKRQKEYKWFYDQIDEVKIKEKISPYDFTIQYPEISELFPVIINNWFEKESNLDVVYDLYTNEFYKITHLTSTFLNFMQAIEVYHRRSYEGKIIEEEEYDAFKSKMMQFIENEAPEQLKPKFVGSLRYGNERSLNYRLKDLAKSLKPETKLLIFNSKKSFPYYFFKQLIDTRNYLTHYDPENKDIIKTEDRYYAIQILKAFVTILLFKEIGMDEEFILSKLQSDHNLVRNLHTSNQVLQN